MNKSVLIVYYSRSGDTELITQRVIAELKRLGTDNIVVEEIVSSYNFNTCFGWFKAGYHSTFNHTVPLTKPPQHDPSEFDILIVAGPIWAGKLNCPLLTWLQLVKIDILKTSVNVIALCGRFGNENGYKNVEEVIGGPLHSKMAVFSNSQMKKLDEDVQPVIVKFASEVVSSSMPVSTNSLQLPQAESSSGGIKTGNEVESSSESSLNQISSSPSESKLALPDSDYS